MKFEMKESVLPIVCKIANKDVVSVMCPRPDISGMISMVVN